MQLCVWAVGAAAVVAPWHRASHAMVSQPRHFRVVANEVEPYNDGVQVGSDASKPITFNGMSEEAYSEVCVSDSAMFMLSPRRYLRPWGSMLNPPPPPPYHCPTGLTAVPAHRLHARRLD